MHGSEKGTVMSRKDKSPYVRIGLYSLKRVLDVVGKGKQHFEAVVDGHVAKVEVHMNSPRYYMFRDRGTSCVKCGLKSKYFALERPKGVGNNPDKYHFNLYGVLPDGNERMMTKDHIIPKAKGGKDRPENYQPMCVRCNVKKADNLECSRQK